VNPSTVIGHSTTGEAGQYIGLADLVRNLWTGRLPALAGTSRTFVPVVTVDHLARFTAAIPEHDPEPGGVHCVLDEDTPDLPELVRLLAGHLGVRAPRLIVPVGLVRRLPTALTGVDPEGLTFLSEDRYDTRSAHRVEAAAGLRPPPVEPALRRWADRLVAERFGTAGRAEPGGFHEIAGSRTYLIGDRVTPAYVLLHGLPVDGEAWQAVRAGLDAPALIADLPGLGRSSPSPAVRPAAGEGAGGRPGSPGNADAWLEALLGPVSTKPVIVAHSAAGAPALRYATAYPDRVAGVLLISPYFLQRPAPWYLRRPALATPMLRRVTPERLASALVGPDAARSEHARRAADSAAAQLHRPGVAARTARWLAAAGRPAERAELSRLLAASPVPVHIVAGELDPLSGGPLRVPVTTVAGAGHHPQISHPEAVVAAATALREAEPAAG
jgi:pimeloyl-ACP methyl ester carboxylesterase